MADRLQWVTINAFPGVDVATTDHLIQPRRLGPATMRRMLSVDPFTNRGQFEPAPGYSVYSVTNASQGLFGHVAGSSQSLYKVFDLGKLYYQSGVNWVQVVSSHLPFHATNKVAFCSGYNALFMVDSSGRVKIRGWGYSATDTTLEWDTEHVIAEILYTYGQKSEPTTSDDDFAADGLCFHASRLVLWKGNEVRFSAPFLPTVFYDALNEDVEESYLLVEDGTGQDITWGGTFENQMLVLSLPSSLWGYVGTDPANLMSRILLDEGRGVYAPGSACIGGSRVYFCSYDGPCYLDMKKGVEFIGDPISTLWQSLTYQERKAVTGYWDGNIYHIFLPVLYEDPPQNNLPAESMIQFSYDPVTKRWAQSHGPAGPLAVIAPVAGERYALTYNAGTIYKQNNGTLANTVAITQELITPWLTFGELWRDKWLRMISFELVQSAETLDIAYGVDNEEAFVETVVAGKLPDDVWGEVGLKWLPASDTAHAVWNGAGKYTIELPHSVHFKSFRLRIRGEGLKIRAIGLGYTYEGT